MLVVGYDWSQASRRAKLKTFLFVTLSNLYIYKHGSILMLNL